jgi:hypothetical protein
MIESHVVSHEPPKIYNAAEAKSQKAGEWTTLEPQTDENVLIA